MPWASHSYDLNSAFFIENDVEYALIMNHNISNGSKVLKKFKRIFIKYEVETKSFPKKIEASYKWQEANLAYTLTSGTIY